MNGKKLGDKDKPWAPPMMSRQGEVFISFKKRERKKEGQREGRNQRRREGGEGERRSRGSTWLQRCRLHCLGKG